MKSFIIYLPPINISFEKTLLFSGLFEGKINKIRSQDTNRCSFFDLREKEKSIEI